MCSLPPPQQQEEGQEEEVGGAGAGSHHCVDAVLAGVAARPPHLHHQVPQYQLVWPGVVITGAGGPPLHPTQTAARLAAAGRWNVWAATCPVSHPAPITCPPPPGRPPCRGAAAPSARAGPASSSQFSSVQFRTRELLFAGGGCAAHSCWQRLVF